MSTGDIKNNLRKLQSETKAIKYERGLDIESMSLGQPQGFLPIYHYVFIEYSRPVAEQIRSISIDLIGKTDQRFIEAMYKVLRELYSYKPPINKEQFFNSSFAERKVIMCTEILSMVRSRHKSLAPKPKCKTAGSRVNLSTNFATNNSTLMSRSVSAASHGSKDGAKNIPAQKKTAAPVPPATTSAATIKATTVTYVPTKATTIVATIVNEVRNSGSSTSSSSQQGSLLGSVSKAQSSTEMPPPPPSQHHNTMPRAMFEKEIICKPSSSPIRQPPPPAAAANIGPSSQYNPAAYGGGGGGRALGTVEVINMVGTSGVASSVGDDLSASHAPRPIDMVPVTPARSLLQQHPTQGQPPLEQEQPTNRDVHANVALITQTIQSLSERVGRMDERLARVETAIDGQVEMETLLARVTLMENRVHMVEHKTSSSSNNNNSSSSSSSMGFRTNTPIASGSKLGRCVAGNNSRRVTPSRNDPASGADPKSNGTDSKSAVSAAAAIIKKRGVAAAPAVVAAAEAVMYVAPQRRSTETLPSQSSSLLSLSSSDAGTAGAARGGGVSPEIFSQSPEGLRAEAETAAGAEEEDVMEYLSPISSTHAAFSHPLVTVRHFPDVSGAGPSALSGAGDFTISPDVVVAGTSRTHFTDGSLLPQSVDGPASDQIIRISRMIQNTESMMNPRTEDSPLRLA